MVDDDPELLEEEGEEEEWVEGEGVTAAAAAQGPANTHAQGVSNSCESGEAAGGGGSGSAGGGGSGDGSGVGVFNATRRVSRRSQTAAAATPVAGLLHVPFFPFQLNRRPVCPNAIPYLSGTRRCES